MRSLFLSLILIASAFATPWLGISFNKKTYNDHIELHVKGVHPESGAFTLIDNGDVITHLNNQQIKTNSDITNAVKGKKTGDKVKVTFSREGKSKTIDVALTERPENISSLMGSAIGSKAIEFGNNFYANAEKRNVKPKVTLLDFWATWCGPCRQAMPILHSLYNELAGQGLEVIGVSSEGNDVLAKFQQQFPGPYPMYRDAKQEMWSRYKISSVPTLMLLDENGYILKVWHGIRSEKALRDAVKEALK